MHALWGVAVVHRSGILEHSSRLSQKICRNAGSTVREIHALKEDQFVLLDKEIIGSPDGEKTEGNVKHSELWD